MRNPFCSCRLVRPVALRPGNVHNADAWDAVLKPVVTRYHGAEPRLHRSDGRTMVLTGLHVQPRPAVGDVSAIGGDHSSRLPAAFVNQVSQLASAYGASHLLDRYFEGGQVVWRHSRFMQILWGERRGDYIHRRGCKPNDGAPPWHSSASRMTLVDP